MVEDDAQIMDLERRSGAVSSEREVLDGLLDDGYFRLSSMLLSLPDTEWRRGGVNLSIAVKLYSAGRL